MQLVNVIPLGDYRTFARRKAETVLVRAILEDARVTAVLMGTTTIQNVLVST